MQHTVWHTAWVNRVTNRVSGLFLKRHRPHHFIFFILSFLSSPLFQHRTPSPQVTLSSFHHKSYSIFSSFFPQTSGMEFFSFPFINSSPIFHDFTLGVWCGVLLCALRLHIILMPWWNSTLSILFPSVLLVERLMIVLENVWFVCYNCAPHMFDEMLIRRLSCLYHAFGLSIISWNVCLWEKGSILTIYITFNACPPSVRWNASTVLVIHTHVVLEDAV